jgi:hypothetical protein
MKTFSKNFARAMNLKKQTVVLALAVITALTITVSIVSSHNIPGKHSSALSDERERTIIGVWQMALTTVDCQTDEVVRSIPGLWTFHKGGTMSEYASAPGLSPALRGSGHGVWQREHGWQDYSLAFIFHRYNASGVFTGSQRAKIALKLGASGDEFTATSAIEILDANDNVILTACGTPTGTRFGDEKGQPENWIH